MKDDDIESDLEEIDYGEDDDDDDQDDFSHYHKEPHHNNDKQQPEKPPANENDSGDEEDEDDVDEDDVDDDDDDDEDNIRTAQEEGEQSKDPDDKQTAERCKYWPSCNAGDECSYYHPTVPCRTFPNCRFGSKCLYIHPPCKFNPNCARPGCPFAHPIGGGAAAGGGMGPSAAPKRARAPGYFRALQQPLAPKCKYGFKCTNLLCKFSHQASGPCRFGANCLLESCPYTHPTDVARKRPANPLKWSAQQS